jgi:hypothetical protein
VDSIHLPNAIALPTAFGAPGTPLPAGQVVQALVLELIESDVFRLQLPQAVVDVRSDVPLTPGSTITLAVKSGGANARLVIYSDAPSTAPAGQGAAPSLTGRQPIGEAVVIARAATPAPIALPAQGKVSAEPATIRDALPLSPAPAPVLRPPEAPAVRVLTPQQAVGEAVQTAAPRQAGLAPLFADVEQVVQNAPQTVPAPVRQAAADVLSLRVPLDEQLTASDVKQAFVRSGVLFEPRLAAARGTPALQAALATPESSNDLKAALLVFRQVLKVWSASEPVASRPVVSSLPSATTAPDAPERPMPLPAGDAIKRVTNALAGLPDEPMPQSAPLSPEQATSLAKTLATVMVMRDTPSAPASPNAVPPPYRGAPLNAQAAAAPSLAPDAAPREAAERLIAETDGALARQTLLQVASLPEQPDLPRADAAQRWSFEVPFATPQGTSIAQFEVSRDGRTPKSDPQERVWRARFSLDVEPMGPVHAMIALTGARASVSLWAERLTTATQLNENAALLSEALRAAELEPADFQLRVGAPPVVAKQAAPGRFMDRAS